MIVVVRHKRRIFASMRYTIHSSSPPTSQRQRNLCITEPKIPTSSTIQCHNCFPEHNASGLMCVCARVYLVSCRIYCEYKTFHLTRSTQRFGNDVLCRERNRFEIMCIIHRYRRSETRLIISRRRFVLLHVFGEFIPSIYRVVHLTWVQWTLCVREVSVVCICLSGIFGFFWCRRRSWCCGSIVQG